MPRKHACTKTTSGGAAGSVRPPREARQKPVRAIRAGGKPPGSTTGRNATAGTLAGRNRVSSQTTHFDVTRYDGDVYITSPRTGVTKAFRLRTMPPGGFAGGSRVLARLYDNGFAKGFAFVDEFGVRVWSRHAGREGARGKYEKYADMLERPSHYAAKGCVYEFVPE